MICKYAIIYTEFIDEFIDEYKLKITYTNS